MHLATALLIGEPVTVAAHESTMKVVAEHLGSLVTDPVEREVTGRASSSPRRYQPRWASRCGTGMSSTLMPTIASPRPRETFATTSGSS